MNEQEHIEWAESFLREQAAEAADHATGVLHLIDGLRLEVELTDGTVHAVPISVDFSTLSADDAQRSLELGGEDPIRVSAAFVALKANQTMGLSDEGLVEVVDVLAGFMAGDESNLVVT